MERLKNFKTLTVVTIFGFASGLPLPFVSGTFQAWLTAEGVDIKTIGILTALTLPYSVKFLWSPFLDRYVIPPFGRRRGWILLSQVLIFAGIVSMVMITPENLFLLSIVALTVAFFSASQDIAIDAYRTEILSPKDRGVGASFAVTAYRVALIVAGGLCLLLADYIGWKYAITATASLLVLGLLASLWADEPKGVQHPRNLKESFIEPFRDLLHREKSFILLLFIILYKLGDAYAGSLSTAFFIRGVGFSLSEVGTVNKIGGLVSSIVGAVFAGFLLKKMSLFKALLYFGGLQAISNLMFMVLAIIGKSMPLFMATVVIENFTGGMGTTAFLALLMGICNRSYAATQYALLSSLASLGRIVITPTSGFVVDAFGWSIFYLLTFFVALPGLLLIFRLKIIILPLSCHTKPDGAKF